MTLGGWNLDEVKGCNLPQKVQTAFTAVTSELVDMDYEPATQCAEGIAYLGSQQVNGTNYRILVLMRTETATPDKKLVKMIINEAPDGSVRLVSISGAAL